MSAPVGVRAVLRMVAAAEYGVSYSDEAVQQQMRDACAAVAELIEPVHNLCKGLPHRHADLVAVLGAANAHEVMRTRAALARVQGKQA